MITAVTGEPRAKAAASERTVGDAFADCLARYAWVVLVLLLAGFVACAVIASKQKPIWYDEFFTYAVATQPTVHRFFEAMPPEGNPPLYTFLAKLSLEVFGAHALALRLPAMVGFGAALIGLWVFVRRVSNGLYGLLAVAMVLAQPVWMYSFEARPYGVMLACTMLALVSWQAAAHSLERDPGASRRLALAGLAVGIVGAIFSHYIGLLEVTIPLLFGEGYRTYRRRALDRPLLITGAVACLSFGFVLPMMHRTKEVVINRSPFTLRFISTHLRLYIHGLKTSWEQIFDGRVLLLLLWLAVMSWTLRPRADPRDRPQAVFGRVPSDAMAAAVGAAMLVPLTWLAMQTAKGYYFCRYGIGSVFGVALVTTLLLARRKEPSRPMLVLLVFVLGTMIRNEAHYVMGFPAVPPQVTYGALYADTSGLPVVVMEAFTYPTIWWYAPEPLKRRLVYLADVSEHSNNGERLLDAVLVAEGANLPASLSTRAEFLRSHQHFLIYDDAYEGPLKREQLMSSGCMASPMAGQGSGFFDVRCQP